MIAKANAKERGASKAEAQPASEKRRVSQDERRAAILDAALDVFAENGFAAARLDDVAQKAGVAKGTLYLYFPDKEALFEDLLRGVASPVLDRFAALSADTTIPAGVMLERILEVFASQIIGTKRERLVRLIITEGPRFPGSRNSIIARSSARAERSSAPSLRVGLSAASFPPTHWPSFRSFSSRRCSWQ